MTKVKVLLHYNEQAFNEERAYINLTLPKFNAVLAAYAALGLPEVTNDELPRLFQDTENFVIDKMINGQPLLLAGLPVKREKANDLIVKPDGYETLESAIKEIKSLLIGHGYFQLENFELVNGALQLKDEVNTELQEKHKKYARSQKQADVYTNFQQIASAMEELSKLGVWFGNGAHTHGNTIADAIDYSGSRGNEKFRVRVDYVLSERI